MKAEPAEPSMFDPRLGDWRTAKPVWVTGLDGTALPEPLVAHQVSHYRDERSIHSFTTPSAVALHLNSAWRLAAQASELKANLRWNTNPRNSLFGIPERHISDDSVSTLFDYLELMMLAAFSSFAAVEAFCNGVIIEKAASPVEVKGRKGEKKLMPPLEVERNLPTDDKLKRVVPDLLCRPTPAGKAVWVRYLTLKDLRDSVTHFKLADQARPHERSHEPTALLKLIQFDPFELPATALAVVSYFYAPEDQPRWMRNPSWGLSPVAQ